MSAAPPARSKSPGAPGARARARALLPAVALVALAVAAYAPALGAGFVWDDDFHVTRNPELRSLEGLSRIWLVPRATPQYYPLVHTSFWIEYRLWGLRAAGYHLVNVLLHALAAILAWRALRALAAPGAWLAAALFAVHPVQVESVAWVTERKNVLALALSLGAFLAWLRFSPLEGPSPRTGRDAAAPRPLRAYVLASGLYLAALLSKSVSASLPAAILLVGWWKRGRLARADLLALLPWLAAGAAAGLHTAHLERTHVGAEAEAGHAVGEYWHLGPDEKLVVAGRALWFYVGKLAWPSRLAFNYPRLRLDAGDPREWAAPVAAVTLALALWAGRRSLGRAPLVAALFFAGTLFPALGFVAVAPFRYSFVADHFQYAASLGPIALAAAALARARRALGMPGPLAAVAAAALLGLLATLAFRQAGAWRDAETLWRDTLAKNPSSWLAHNNLATILARRGERAAALAHLHAARRADPTYAETYVNLAIEGVRAGDLRRAEGHARIALRLIPTYGAAHGVLGSVLSAAGRHADARRSLAEAVRLAPRDARAHAALAMTLWSLGARPEATAHFAEAARLEPGNPAWRRNLERARAAGAR